MATLAENVIRAISDFDSIKNVLENKGIDCSNIKTSEYADKIVSSFNNNELEKELIDGNIETLKVPQGIKAIRKYFLYENTTLKTLETTDVQNIGELSFFSNTALKNVYLGSGIKTIDDSAFEDCIKLTDLVLPEGLINIGNSAFRNCCSLQNLKIPHSVETIQPFAFYYCSSLNYIELPNTISSIPDTVFGMVTSVKNIKLEQGFDVNRFYVANFDLETESIVSMLESLCDRNAKTSYTLLLGQNNKSKLTQEQIAIATNKNWTLQ